MNDPNKRIVDIIEAMTAIGARVVHVRVDDDEHEIEITVDNRVHVQAANMLREVDEQDR